MGFRQADSEGRGGFARIWSIEDKGNYSIAKISTRKRRKDGDGYETDFQDGFVRLIGAAHTKAQSLMPISEKGIVIQITSCEVTTPYDQKTKKGYVNYAIFSFEIPDRNDGEDGTSLKSGKKSAAKITKGKAKKEIPVDDEPSDDDLPF